MVVARLPYCAVCRVVVKPGELLVFRPDGEVQHPSCPEVLCPACTRPIRPGEPIRRDGEMRLHRTCWMRQYRARAASVTSLALKISDKVQAGLLPNHLPEKLGGGFGGGHACDSCDDPILLGQAEYTYELRGDRILRLHISCVELWQAELRRRVENGRE